MYLALNSMTGEDAKKNCPLCDYFEIWSSEDDATLFYCKNENCRKWTCLVCREKFNYPRDICNLTKEEIAQIERGEWASSHIKWIEYKDYVQKIVEIWEKNNIRFCPSCGKGGRKNNFCTFITCECKKMFCYFCQVFKLN